MTRLTVEHDRILIIGAEPCEKHARRATWIFCAAMAVALVSIIAGFIWRIA